jgi:hypothetical protein
MKLITDNLNSEDFDVQIYTDGAKEIQEKEVMVLLWKHGVESL